MRGIESPDPSGFFFLISSHIFLYLPTPQTQLILTALVFLQDPLAKVPKSVSPLLELGLTVWLPSAHGTSANVDTETRSISEPVQPWWSLGSSSWESEGNNSSKTQIGKQKLDREWKARIMYSSTDCLGERMVWCQGVRDFKEIESPCSCVNFPVLLISSPLDNP